MKRLIPTILLVIICIGGFWYASSKDFFREKKVELTKLVTLTQDQVQAISISSKENQIELQRQDKGWTMSRPSALPLNPNLIGGWIDSFGLVTADKVIDANAANLATYGLDNPSQTYKATLKDGSVKSLQVGEALPIQGYFYAKVEGSPAVYQVSEQVLTGLNKAPLDLMDTSPVQFDKDQVQSVKVTWKGQTWTLTKTDKDKAAAGAAWKLGDKDLAGTDASPLLDQLTFLHTAELAKPSASVSMNAPELAVEVSLKDESGKDSTALYQGKLDQEKVWLVKQGDEWAYAVKAADIQAIADAYAGKGK